MEGRRSLPEPDFYRQNKTGLRKILLSFLIWDIWQDLFYKEADSVTPSKLISPLELAHG